MVILVVLDALWFACFIWYTRPEGVRGLSGVGGGAQRGQGENYWFSNCLSRVLIYTLISSIVIWLGPPRVYNFSVCCIQRKMVPYAQFIGYANGMWSKNEWKFGLWSIVLAGVAFWAVFPHLENSISPSIFGKMKFWSAENIGLCKCYRFCRSELCESMIWRSNRIFKFTSL
jgi:hypothetical protein